LRSLVKQRRPFAIAMADLDHFKQLNDTHGHEAGDRALRFFAETAQAVLRDDDVIARWGGEEFVIVVPDLDRHEAANVLERIRERLVEFRSGDHPAFTASFGLTDSSRAGTLEALLKFADAGLYEAKEAGRDRVCIIDARPSSGPVVLEAREADLGSEDHRRHATSLYGDGDEEDPRPSGLEIR
jgi:diguanylate cyclase (GGDEF)-like protein